MDITMPIIKHMPVWLTIVASILMTYLLVTYIAATRDELASSAFHNTANKLVDEISTDITDSLKAIYHLASFYHGSEHVTREEFNQYVGGFIKHYPELHAMEWAPRIPHRQRHEHEQQQSAFQQDYTITENSKINSVTPATERAYYFPITYIYPLTGNESALGYDLASNPVRKAMLEYSVFSNSMTVSSRIRLVQEKDASYAVLFALPVMTGGKVSLSLDSPHLQGMVVGVLRLDPIIDKIIEYMDFKQMDIIISEHTEGYDQARLIQHRISNLPTHSYVHSRVIKVANRDWLVAIKADPILFGAYTVEDLLVVLSVAVGFTALLAAYIHLLLCNQRQAEQDSQYLLSEIDMRQQYENKLVVSNSKLETLSREDPVMNIANRRAFNEYLVKEWKRAQRSGFPLSVIIADLDNFKAFNDRYGHVVGDHCLLKVATAFKNIANRPSDMAARYGGEEIAVILPETLDEGAVTVAERIRQAVVDLSIPHEDSGTRSVVTISLGVTTVMNVADYTLDEIINSADAALYMAKQQGKNQVVQIAPGEHEPVDIERGPVIVKKTSKDRRKKKA